MTNMVIGVELRANSAGLVGQLNDAQLALRGLGGSENSAAASALELNNASRAAAAGLSNQAEQARGTGAAMMQALRGTHDYAAMTEKLRAAIYPTYAAQRQFDQEMATASQLLKAGAISASEYAAAQGLARQRLQDSLATLRQSTSAGNDHALNLGLQRAGYQQLGFQMQDVFASYASGSKLTTIFAQQSGQMVSALAMIGQAGEGSKGKLGAFASFIGGPWGIALGVGVSIVGALAGSLLTAKDASDKVRDASVGLTDVQSSLGDVFDFTTGKIKLNTSALDANTQAAILNLQAKSMDLKVQAIERRDQFAQTVRKAASPSASTLMAAGVSEDPALLNSAYDESNRGLAVTLLRQVEQGRLPASKAFDRLKGLNYANAQIGRDDALQALRDIVSARGMEDTAAQIDKSLEGGALTPSLRSAVDRGKHGRTARPQRSQGSTKTTESAAEKISEIRAQFEDVPSEVGQVNKALAELDKISASIQKRTLPDYKGSQADIAKTRDIIKDSLLKPFDEYMAKARESVEIDRLLASGKTDQAEAMKVILGMQARGAPLEAEHYLAVLRTVEAERKRAMVLRDQQALIQDNITAVNDMRGALEQTVAGMLQGRFSVNSILNSLGTSFVQITSRRIVESMFGDTLRALEDQASGHNRVDEAGAQMATAMGRGSSAVVGFADTMISAIARINAASPGAATGVGSATVPSGSWLERTMTEWAGIDMRQSPSDGGNNEIVVSGSRPGSTTRLPGSFFVDLATQISGAIGLKVPPALAGVMKSALGTLESRLPEVMAGAMAGSAASKLLLGSNGNSTGGAIGGALGQAAGKALTKGMTGILGAMGGPLGSILGGVLGGVLGGLFTSKPHGAATITSTTDKAQVSASTGEIASGLNQMSTGVQGALKQIADRLGADVGSFAVSIGQYKDYYQVSSVANDPYLGKSNYNKKSSNALYDGKDASAAVAAAIQNAIADGGVKGLSAAVEKALKSSPDIDVALAEALKVQAVEMAIGGLGATLAKQFRDFERQAADRLRIATQYGFDVVKMEERNAADRLALTRKLEAEQTGSLQSLIDSMTSGSLFEGNILDQRQAVLDQIAAAKADANAGVEGAADKLAGLLEQLNSISRDAYGTTGGFAADRATILNDAHATIATANQRIADAAKASDPALETTNAALNEVNDQIAALNVRTGDVTALLTQLVAQGSTSDFSSLARLASTWKLAGA